jgi:hypothetical protein
MDIPPDVFIKSFLKSALEHGIGAAVFYDDAGKFVMTSNLGPKKSEGLVLMLRTSWLADPGAIEAAARALYDVERRREGWEKGWDALAAADRGHYTDGVRAIVAALTGRERPS